MICVVALLGKIPHLGELLLYRKSPILIQKVYGIKGNQRIVFNENGLIVFSFQVVS